MKLHKILALLVAALIVAGALTSCQLSSLFGKDSFETDENGAVKSMDLTDTNLKKYVKLGQYKGIGISVETPALSEDELDEAIAELLAGSAYHEELTDRATASGDTVNIDFEGYMDGVKFDNGTAADQELELSDESGYIDGFADGLVGVMPGVEVTLNLTFPADYYEDLAGKAVTFLVTVNYILGEYITPEFNDEFVKEHTGGKYATTSAFREYYRSKLEADLAAEAESEAYTNLWKTIVDNAEVVKYPEQQVRHYFDAQKQQYENYAASNSVDYATILAYMGVTEESMTESAENYTKEDLVFYSIVKAEGFEISDAEYATGAAAYAEQAGATVAELEDYYGKDYIVECLLWDKVLKQLFIWAEAAE